jgi:hypothetical protein
MKEIIKTSDNEWLEKSLKQYTEKNEFTFLDDANLGLTKDDLKSAIKLIKAAKSKGGKTIKQITAVLVGLGVSAAGITIVILAIFDPEPTTKLGLLITGGFFLAITGAYGTLRALGISYSVSAKKGDAEFIIKPE